MGMRKILTDKEPSLHKVCKPVTKFDWRLHKLLDDMAETLAEANGVGLAAPQVGILRRVVIVDTGDGILELVNPTLVETSGEQIGGNFVYARKPNPAYVAMTTDPASVRAETEKTVKICQKYGCPLEFVLKDISTVGHKPENLIVWANTVADVLDEFYGV